MFTGIIEETGVILEKIGGGDSIRFSIGADRIMRDMKSGDSISIDGVCLTVENFQANRFTVYSSPETLAQTTLLKKTARSKVNLERAMLPDERLGGHIVLGHVDGVGEITQIHKKSDSWRFTFHLPAELMKFCVEKGSIAINGASLTIASLDDDNNDISVAVIPYTFENTTMVEAKKGDAVNVETDIFARYVLRFLKPYHDKNNITEEFLRKSGFM